MPVHENLHAYYWAERESYQSMLDVAKKQGRTMGPYALIDMETQRPVGGGCIDPTDGADEIAWLSCMFGEMNDWKMAFMFPGDCTLDLSNAKNVHQVDMHVDQLRGATKT